MTTRDLFELTGSVAVVTGGSRGLGLRIAEALGEFGARVAIVARKPPELEDAASTLSALGIEAATFQADISRNEDIPRLVDGILARFGTIDILVNNAATSWAQPAEDHSREGWDKVMALNLTAAFALTQEIATRAFIPQRRGRIVNVASIGALRANRPEFGAKTLAYNASKAALVSLTRALAVEWGQYGITANALCPGFFRSKMADRLIEQIEDQLIAATPLGRVADDHDFRGAALFLCSAASQHMTGQTLVIDGGMTAC